MCSSDLGPWEPVWMNRPGFPVALELALTLAVGLVVGPALGWWFDDPGECPDLGTGSSAGLTGRGYLKMSDGIVVIPPLPAVGRAYGAGFEGNGAPGPGPVPVPVWVEIGSVSGSGSNSDLTGVSS